MSSFSLQIKFSRVADVDAKYVARTWFFLILKPSREVSDLYSTSTYTKKNHPPLTVLLQQLIGHT